MQVFSISPFSYYAQKMSIWPVGASMQSQNALQFNLILNSSMAQHFFLKFITT